MLGPARVEGPPVKSRSPIQLIHSFLDGGQREARLFVTLAVLLVLVRAATFALVEGIVFNSDEALYGLMAKHLSEFRTFPLFSYGENYQLAVEAWITAPFFWIFRPSVVVMKIPLVILNVAVAVMLMRTVCAALHLRPAFGFLAALPFIMPTPVVAGSLMTNSGSATEPLLYIPLLWLLRRRPFAFGALLMFGFLHREFTIYAVPAILLAGGLEESWWTAAAAARVAWTVVGSAVTWTVIDQLKLYLVGSSAFEQAEMLAGHTCWRPAELPARLGYVITSVLPVFASASRMSLHAFAFRNLAVAGGFTLVGWVMGATMVLMLARLAWTWRRGDGRVAYALYLAIVGCLALAAYPLSCNLAFGLPPVLRYLHLALFLPIGCFAAFIAREPSRYLRTVAIGAFLLWGGVNLVDNLHVMRVAYVTPDPDPHRELTDFLLSHQIRYARANFWDAYIVDFLSRERVIVDSNGPVRIPDYKRLVDEFSYEAVRIVRMPCAGDLYVSDFCIQLPAGRPTVGPR